MDKKDLAYGIVGVALGLVMGFLVGNWTTPSGEASGITGASGAMAAKSVNSPRETELPPGHPAITPGETVPAPPLPGGADASDSASPGTAGPVILPSLDTLPASSREERAEKKYKNIQMLKGLPADRIESIMFAFKNSLGVECTYCHVKDQFEKDDKTAKQTARKMISLVRDANGKVGAAKVSCYTCHRGHPRPPE